MAKIMTFDELQKCRSETALYLETKQTLRPCFFFGMKEFPNSTPENRFALHLMTVANIAKYWWMRNYNKTWRLWNSKPTREQMMEEKWDG